MKYNKLNIPIITTNSGNNTNFIGIEHYKYNIFYNRFIGFISSRYINNTLYGIKILVYKF